jgi:hypothetical protein
LLLKGTPFGLQQYLDIFFNKWVTPQAKTAKVALSQGDPKLTDDGTLRRGVANVLDVLDRYHHRYLS